MKKWKRDNFLHLQIRQTGLPIDKIAPPPNQQMQIIAKPIWLVHDVCHAQHATYILCHSSYVILS
jgi:hypothetical protein